MKFGKALKLHLQSTGMSDFSRMSKPHMRFSLDEGEYDPVFWRDNVLTGKTKQHSFSAEEVMVDDWCLGEDSKSVVSPRIKLQFWKIIQKHLKFPAGFRFEFAQASIPDLVYSIVVENGKPKARVIDRSKKTMVTCKFSGNHIFAQDWVITCGDNPIEYAIAQYKWKNK